MAQISVATLQIASNKDNLTITCTPKGNLEDNYEEFLCVAAEAVLHIKANYESGCPADMSAPHVQQMQQWVINALDQIFNDER
jgi:hypothetical protein